MTSWIKESDSIWSDSYFTMLFNMQSEKVNKIIFAPALKQIKEKYEKLGFGITFLKEMFSGVRIRTLRTKNEKIYRISLDIEDRYLCYVLMLTCRLNKYSYSDETRKIEQEISKKILDGIDASNCNLSFEEVLKIVGDEELLEAFSWVKLQLEFSFGILENCENNSIGRKKKVASILEEL